MKRILALPVVLLISVAVLYLAQRRQHRDSVSANAVLNLTADWQRDLTRVPMRLTRLSDRQETQIGDALARQYVAAMPPLAPPMELAQSYVASVGDRVASHARRKLDYRFHLIADPNYINAFALPGGHVFIGLGLLKQMTSEDALAFVLGHEIEHIDHYHAVERVQMEAQLHKLDLDAVAALAQIPMSLWQAGYSKDEEFEADREGLRIAAVAGYSPQGAVDLLTRFLKLDRQYITHAETPAGEMDQVVIEGLAGYFRSHPETSERLAQVKRVIAEDHMEVNGRLTPLSDAIRKTAAGNSPE
jgi:beta-barrel assembly-enhancing protease